jgi:hypothetical protein
MIFEYHDHVCDTCQSTIKSQCECNTRLDEEFCDNCRELGKDVEQSQTEEVEKDDVEEPEEEATDEEEFYEDEARRILEPKPKQE